MPSIPQPVYGLPFVKHPAGALVLLEQHTADASASLDFTSCISSTYDEYLIEIVGLVPATNGVGFWMRMSTDRGSTYDAGANYGWMAWVMRAAATAATGVEGGATKVQLGYSTDIRNTSGWGAHGSLRLFDPASTTLYKRVFGQLTSKDTNYRLLNDCTGTYESLTAVNAFQFLFSTGNIASGTIRVYGVAK